MIAAATSCLTVSVKTRRSHPASDRAAASGKDHPASGNSRKVWRSSRVRCWRRAGRSSSGVLDRRWAEAEARAQRGTAALLLDEVHHLSDWRDGSRATGIALAGAIPPSTLLPPALRPFA